MLHSLKSHTSIRKFLPRAIEKEVLDSVLESASRASNTGNMQWYSIIVTTEQSLKQKLQAECHFNQAMVSQAPVLLTFCADVHRFEQWCELRDAKPQYDNFLSFYTATVDAVIAAQNACIAAEEHGLGICYLGTTNYTAPKIIDILAMPRGVFPVTTVVMGYADEQPALTDRLPLSAVVHHETYNDYSPESIEAIYQAKEQLPLYVDLVKTNNTANLAQIFTQKRYTGTNNITFSRTMLDTLKKQGFMNQ